MPDPNTALDKRKLLDALDDRPARKWYRAQYVDIAIQTDFVLATLVEDAPTNSGADVNDLRSQTATPKVLVPSTITSNPNDSPTVKSRSVPRACIDQSSVQRTDVAPFTPASPKDSAPTLIVSPSRAASHTKAADTFAPALSAPILAMSSSEWMPSTAVTDVATSAVRFLNVSTSAPVFPTSATCTPSHGAVLNSRLSGPTPPSSAWTMLAVSSEFSHSGSDVRSDTSPSSSISSHGPTLATPSTPAATVLSHSSRSPPHGDEKPIPVPPASESLNRPRRIWGKEPHHDSDMRFLTNSPSPKRLGMKITPAQLPSASPGSLPSAPPGPLPSASPEPGPSEQAEVAFKRRTRRAGKHMREKKEKYRLRQLQLKPSSSDSQVDMTEEQPASAE